MGEFTCRFKRAGLKRHSSGQPSFPLCSPLSGETQDPIFKPFVTKPQQSGETSSAASKRLGLLPCSRATATLSRIKSQGCVHEACALWAARTGKAGPHRLGQSDSRLVRRGPGHRRLGAVGRWPQENPRLDPPSLPAALSGTRLGPCVGRVGNFVAIGLNFADHAAETGSPIPAEPILFNKAPSCIVGPNDDVIIPRGSQKTDWEVELAIVIGERASLRARKRMRSTTSPATASATTCPSASSSSSAAAQWIKGKGCPTFGPLGPWLVTKDEIPDVQNLAMWLDVNGERRAERLDEDHDLRRARSSSPTSRTS